MKMYNIPCEIQSQILNAEDGIDIVLVMFDEKSSKDFMYEMRRALTPVLRHTRLSAIIVKKPHKYAGLKNQMKQPTIILKIKARQLYCNQTNY